ncbi:MAG: N-acetylmuramoyl-L-alanine amidase [Oscillospiraceae bacterium]|jgi:hypothetical protein|nr:N-acetylmuramoyl-L-alanine amidase [Oscillospiraceae bacterium]
MPFVLLSSCGNDAAEYCNGATESAVTEAILNRLAEYLLASGLQTALRLPQVPSHAVASVANRENAALLLLLGSSAAPPEQAGQQRGADICFHPAAKRSRALAERLLGSLACVAPSPDAVRLLPSPQLPDFRMARCPAVQLRLGYRDHPEDAVWMLQSTGGIAHALAKAVTQWFGVPCVSPFAGRSAVVRTPNGSLALRRAPHKEAEMLQTIPNGAELTLLHREGEWQYAEHEDCCGYVLRKYLQI